MSILMLVALVLALAGLWGLGFSMGRRSAFKDANEWDEYRREAERE